MRADFHGFELAYAETSNHEVLLNLARLRRREPTYFFKMGQITSSYRMQASLTGTGNYTPQGTVPGGAIPTGGGTPSVLVENDPVFQFIPVNDETSAELLFKPIQAETFYILYQQGWRADQLFRLMVDRIELTHQTPRGCEVQVIRNVPPVTYSGTLSDYDKQANELTSYATFLRVSALVYALQKHGLLLLTGEEKFVPFDKDSVLDKGTAPSATNFNDAASKGTIWKHDASGAWVLGSKVFSAKFELNPHLEVAGENGVKAYVPDQKAIQAIIEDDFPELKRGPALRTSLAIMAAGFSIEGAPNAQQPTENPCAEASSHLVLRSMLGIMAAAAQEQSSFDALTHLDPVIPLDRHIPESLQESSRPHFSNAVPQIERLPLLRMTWGNEHQPSDSVITVSYRGTEYKIADEKDNSEPENEAWNRDMFRLIGQLTSQVTVDISKFPLPQILQLHSQ
jgi:hypothetical protein